MTHHQAVECTRVAIVSTFGPHVRGISPYADYLTKALEEIEQLDLQRVDFESIYPAVLYPASGLQKAENPWAQLHYARPRTWNLRLENQLDLVHLQYWTPVSAHMHLGIVRRARRNGVKTVLTVHNVSPHEKLMFFRRLERRLLKEVDHVVVHTTSGAETIISAGIKSPSQVSVIPHGAPIRENATRMVCSREDYLTAGLSPERRYVMYFGNIRQYKGVDLLLDAWPQVASLHRDVDLVIAGRIWRGRNALSSLAGRLMGVASIGKRISDLADQGKPEQTIYKLEFVENEILFAMCRIAELAVFPYRRFEAQSGAATLVASYGVPLIVSSKGGLSSLAIDSSYVCDSLEAGRLAETISHHLTHPSRDVRRQQRDRLEQIDWSQIAIKHAELYQAIKDAKI